MPVPDFSRFDFPRKTGRLGQGRDQPHLVGLEWKFRGIGPEYASGLRGIAQLFGVNV